MKLAITLFMSATIATSSPKEEYLDFMGDFMQNTQLSFDFNITQYAQGKPMVSKGYYKRSGKEFMLKNENYLVLSSTEVSITVFEQDKIILLNEPTPANNLFVMDASKIRDASINVTETPNTPVGMKLWNISGSLWDGKAIIKADIERKIPVNIAVYTKEANPLSDKPLIKVGFSNVSKIAPDKQAFGIASYIQKKGKAWVTTQKYSTYELINNLD